MEFTFCIGGKTYRASGGCAALARLERNAGAPSEIIVAAALSGSINSMLLLAHALLQRHHNLSLDQVGDLIDRAGGIGAFADLIGDSYARRMIDSALGASHTTH